jgi:hypothetical protein
MLRIALSLALLVPLLTSETALAFDLKNPNDTAEAFVRVRASTVDEPVVTWWKGSVMAVVPGKKPERIFGFEGFNVARMVKDAEGYQMLSREFAVYRDPKTNLILRSWNNPYTNVANQVFHVQNDPVNHKFKHGMPMPFYEQAGHIMLFFDVPLAYPNPLPVKDFPKESGHDLYWGSEHFGFMVDRKELESDKPNVPMTLSWSRNSPWMPWMRMGQREGLLTFAAIGAKLNSFEDLPDDLKQLIRSDYKKYEFAPSKLETPNATTWTEYRKFLEKSKPTKK